MLSITPTSIQYKTSRTLAGLTTSAIRPHRRIKEPVDVSKGAVRDSGLDSELAKLHLAVIRLREKGKKHFNGVGSGVVISSDGLVVTARHVVPDIWDERKGITASAEFQPPIVNPSFLDFKLEGKSIDYWFSTPVKILYRFIGLDLALLKLPTLKEPYSFLPITDSLPKKDEPVYIMGYPQCQKKLAYGKVLVPSLEVPHASDSQQCKSSFEFLKSLPQIFSKIVSMDQEVIISDNKSDKGNSGGLLSNENLEACGVTYGGLREGYILKGYVKALRSYPQYKDVREVAEVTFSHPMKHIIEYLESKGVNIQKMREGEPSKLS